MTEHFRVEWGGRRIGKTWRARSGNLSRGETAMIPIVKFKRLHGAEGLPSPAYATVGAAGLDICAAQDVVVPIGYVVRIPTGFMIEVPPGYEAQVRPRSGWSERGLVIANAPGTIDSDYRGEVMVLARAGLGEEIHVQKGARIAQLVIAPVARAGVEIADALGETKRGAAGFGSTGQ